MNILEYAKYKKMFGGSGGSVSGAAAYHLSSADDLPANAVDGSLAVVTIKPQYYAELTATPNIPDNLWGKSVCIDFYYHDHNVGTTKFDEIYFWDDGSGFSFYGGTISLEEAYIQGEGWQAGGSRLFFVKYPTGELANWINAISDARIQETNDDIEEHSTLYSRENGEWVSKGKI